MENSAPYSHILRTEEIAARSRKFIHPWNPKSEIQATWVGRMAGLVRTGVGVGRLAPGRESFAYHAHHSEEEWVYVVSGRAVARIDGSDYELGPGDFVAFPTPSVPHNMSNPFDEDVVYLMGGENHATDVVDFPELGRRMVKASGAIKYYPMSEGKDVDW
jgi:uncharacterized cupin superfamily protein